MNEMNTVHQLHRALSNALKNQFGKFWDELKALEVN